MVPANARRFRVADEEVAAVLAASGAELVQDAPEVEISPIGAIRGDAPIAVVRFGPKVADGETLLGRVAFRLRANAGARAGALRARHALRARGFRSTAIITWDLEQTVHLARPRGGAPRQQHRRSMAERLPGGAIVVASRSARAPTVFDVAAKEAASVSGEPELAFGCPMARASGVLVAASERHVLRLAMGPGRADIERHRAGLELAASVSDPAVTDRLPELQHHGESGLAYWSIEGRIAGQEPSQLSSSLLVDCLEFLVGLNSSSFGRAPGRSLRGSAALVAAVCQPDAERALGALAHRLEQDLAALPRGIAHGDFWRGNLLAEGDRLRGVVDWGTATGHQLPLLDVINLLVAEQESKYFGRALHGFVLPWARAGGDSLSRGYCERLGLELAPSQLEALAVAWWLERVARELETYADRVRRPAWIEQNVTVVLNALLAGGGR